MKTNIWAKTLLTIYRYLERMAGAIDKMIETRALGSMNVSGANYSENNILSLSEKIINLSERKVKLINIKILIEDSLEKCGKSYARLLIGKYLDECTNTDLCEKFGLSHRTFFRRLSDAERRFESAMESFGFNSNRLDEYLAGEQWILMARTSILATKAGDKIDLKAPVLDRLVAI